MSFVKWIAGGAAFLLLLAMCTSGDKKGATAGGFDAKEIVAKCAREAGIPAGDSSHRISKPEMLVLTACVDIEKAKFGK